MNTLAASKPPRHAARTVIRAVVVSPTGVVLWKTIATNRRQALLECARTLTRDDTLRGQVPIDVTPSNENRWVAHLYSLGYTTRLFRPLWAD